MPLVELRTTDPSATPEPSTHKHRPPAQAVPAPEFVNFAENVAVQGVPVASETLFRRGIRSAGIDRAIAYTILARAWGSLSGFVTVALIARSLSRAEQGYYYTFGSLVALQIVFELGFSVVILQLATHEAAHLSLADDGTIAGQSRGKARLASILQKAVLWYGVAAALMTAVLLPVGWRFFTTSPGSAETGWRGPWIAVVLASCITFQVDPIFSFLEGCGYVSRVARTRTIQAVMGSILAWGALLLHRGLFAPALVIAGQAAVGLGYLWHRRALLLGLLRTKAGEFAVDWRNEVWPFQWRIAISYASGFLIFQLFNPVLLRYFGPVVAGRMGMSLNISNAIAAVAISWIQTKAAPFGAMIARREYTTLDRVFFRSAWQALLLCTTGALAVFAIDLLLVHQHIRFAQRLLPPLPFALLLLTMCLNQAVASMALYLRAHKQEKFLLNSVLGGLLVALSTATLGRWYGPTGMLAGFLVVTIVVGVGMGSWTFVKYRRLWHVQ